MDDMDSEVTDATTDILVEGAHFDPISVARTSRRFRLTSEASKRFERGVDHNLAPYAVQRVVDLLVEYGGGSADDAVTDRSEEHTSELQSRGHLVCRLLLEKKNMAEE